MSACSGYAASTISMPALASTDAQWYALMTRARHEKAVAGRLRDRGIEAFLPVVTEKHRWSDREKFVEVPLFGGYVFVRVPLTNENYYRVCNLDGVVRLVGAAREGTPIPDEQINAVQALVSQNVPWSAYPFLSIGQRVRIRGGAMDGVEGILVARDGDRRLVISIDAIQRSMAISIEGYNLEAA